MKIKLNVGCGVFLKSGYINVDSAFKLEDLLHGEKTRSGQYANAVIESGADFVQGDIRSLSFEDNYADYILCVDVIEHIKMRDVIQALSELYRVLKKGKKLTLMTTDFNDLANRWNKMIRKPFDLSEYINLAEIIYGNQAGNADFETHKSLFNYEFMDYCLKEAGFKTYTIDIHKGGTKHPKLEGYYEGVENLPLRSSMLVVNAIK